MEASYSSNGNPKRSAIYASEEGCRSAIAVRPDDAEAWHQLGMHAFSARRFDDAELALRTAHELQPSVARYCANLATVLGRTGRHGDAVQLLEHAVVAEPCYLIAINNLAFALKKVGRIGEALAAFRRSLAIDEGQANIHFHLGELLRGRGELQGACAAFRRATEVQPQDRRGWSALGTVLAALGQLHAAIDAFKYLCSLPDALPSDHSDLVMFLQYDPHTQDAERLGEALRFGLRYASPPGAFSHPLILRDEISKSSGRRLRIGYISPDFRDHPVGRLIEPPLVEHDRERFEIICYSDVARPDAVTGRLRSLADRWRECRGRPDPEVAKVIYEDRVDILVDLAGHFAGNRLAMFGKKPAPIQMTAFGYCGTTGVSAIDFRITDVHSDPPGLTEHLFTERLIRMPDCAWVYRPAGDDVDSGPCPAESNGFVTFANLNNQVKTSDMIAGAWAAILRRLPNARLLLLSPRGAERSVVERVIRRGATAEQVIAVSPMSRRLYLEKFREIDVALDPFPFNGDNTTCDALWMGVPTISLVGDCFASRRGLSHLTNAGLPDLAVTSIDRYVDAAIALASNAARRASLRQTLRTSIIASPLGDATRFTREIESTYRWAFERWAGGPLKRNLPPVYG